MRATETPILDRLLDPVTRCLTPDVARAWVKLRVDPEIQTRIDDLATKCSEGRLSPVERTEYESYVSAIDLIAILQSKARALLTAAREAS